MRKKRTMEGYGTESHRSSGRGGSAFFICFTALSSSSTAATTATMRVPSCKSLCSVGRCRNPTVPSLSTLLSKRLQNSGSLKGGQSLMFPVMATASGSSSGGRRKGCVLEAVEPSSPKVTCIDQMRVKSKKKKAKAKAAAMARSRLRSKRESGSFRRTEEECFSRKN